MVKLETSAGVFEAPTVREAEKMAKRAAKLQAKQHAERESILEIARARAGLNGLRILRWKAESEDGTVDVDSESANGDLPAQRVVDACVRAAVKYLAR